MPLPVELIMQGKQSHSVEWTMHGKKAPVFGIDYPG